MLDMRIIEPQYTNKSKVKVKKSRIYAKLIMIIITGIAGFMIYQNNSTSTQDSAETNKISQNTGPKELRIFTDNEFKVFYNHLLQPNLERVANPPGITGNLLADTRIRDIAEMRGYRLRNSPNVALVDVDGLSLQEAVKEPWQKLKAEASKAGIGISITSGYRSVDTQRTLFTNRLSATGVTVSQIATGEADTKINEVLVTTSIPGYSKHHTGYTFDLLCNGFAFEDFKNSSCNTWLSENNYEVAKKYGFIPSYPPQADDQGPIPEAWEYIYVGTDLLYE